MEKEYRNFHIFLLSRLFSRYSQQYNVMESLLKIMRYILDIYHPPLISLTQPHFTYTLIISCLSIMIKPQLIGVVLYFHTHHFFSPLYSYYKYTWWGTICNYHALWVVVRYCQVRKFISCWISYPLIHPLRKNPKK